MGADEVQELIRGGADVKTAATMLLTDAQGDGAGERSGVKEATCDGIWTPVLGAVRRGRVDHT